MVESWLYFSDACKSVVLPEGQLMVLVLTHTHTHTHTHTLFHECICNDTCKSTSSWRTV